MDWALTLIVLSWLIVAFMGFVIAVLLRQHGRALLALDDLRAGVGRNEESLEALSAQLANGSPALAAGQGADDSSEEGVGIGSSVPDVTVTDLDGRQRSLREFFGRPRILVFFNTGCGFCGQMAPRIGQLADGGAPFLLVAGGDREEYRRWAAEHNWRCDVVLENGYEISGALQSGGTPTGYLIDSQGRVASRMAIGSEALLNLVPSLATADSVTAQLPAPAPAPAPAQVIVGSQGQIVIDNQAQSSGVVLVQGPTPGPAPVPTLAPPPAPAPTQSGPFRQVPDVTITDLDGRERQLRELFTRPRILVFFNTGCGFCQQMAPRIGQLPDGGEAFVLVSSGDVEGHRKLAADNNWRCDVVFEKNGEVSGALGSGGTPTGYMVDGQGRIASDLGIGAQALLDMLPSLAAADAARPYAAPAAPAAPAPPPSQAGRVIPEFTVTDLDGRERKLQEFFGRPRILAFFNTGCGFCTQMAPRIGQLPDGGEPFLLIAGGDEEQLRQMRSQHNWRCDVVIEKNYEVSGTLGSGGTPTGYLVDAQGRVASELAIGAEALLNLVPSLPTADGSNPLPAQAPAAPAPPPSAAGRPLPDVTVADLQGRQRKLTEVFGGRPRILAFFNTGCGFCAQMAPRIGQLADRGAALVLVAGGDGDQLGRWAAEHNWACEVVIENNSEVSGALGSGGTPTGYLVDARGVVASDLAIGAEALLNLVPSLATADGSNPLKVEAPSAAPPAPTVQAGSSIPDLTVTDLNGGERKLAEYFTGRPRILAFFNTGCGFCAQMAPRIGQLTDRGAALVLVAGGDEDTLRGWRTEHNWACDVVIEKNYEVSGALGSGGTPTGYLVDAQARIASDLAIGAEALLNLEPSLATADGSNPLKLAAPSAAAPAPTQELSIGSAAPADFTVTDLDGRKRQLREFFTRPRILVFFNTGCGFCQQMAPRIGELPDRGESLLLVSVGEAEAHRQLAAQHNWRCDVVLQDGWEVMNAYGANGTPTGYLIDAGGRIGSTLAVGAQAVLDLVPALPAVGGTNGHGPNGSNGHVAAAVPAAPAAPSARTAKGGLLPGQPAPEFRLPDIEGQERALSDFRGKKVLLVFSEPDCNPCQSLGPKLAKLQRRRQRDNVQVVMVSRGDVQTNRSRARQQNLTFPVLLQNQYEVSKQYASLATPVGYLIDEQGMISKPLAVGNDAVLQLV